MCDNAAIKRCPAQYRKKKKSTSNRSRTDSPPSRCVKPLYWTMFYQHFTMHCFYQFLLMSSIFTRILSLAHLFYAYFTHGPNKSASAQYDNTRGAWLTQEGCTITERKEGRTVLTHIFFTFRMDYHQMYII